jgi:hypothetical protein
MGADFADSVVLYSPLQPIDRYRLSGMSWERIAMSLPDYAELFLKYNYAESKDLCKEFLTLVSGVLVFSVTFAEKIVRFTERRARGRWTLFGSWIFLVAALISGGIGLVELGFAANAAVYAPDPSLIQFLGHKADVWMYAGGVLFVLGLLLIVAAGALSMFAKPIGTAALDGSEKA